MREALTTFQPDVVLSDFSLPQFDGLSALRAALEVATDVPFIFVSGTIGEERAVEAVRQGAVDYVLKTNLSRLGPTVTRALAEAAAQRQIARLTRVLRMLSGINGAVIRIRERSELFSEACRLAVKVGGTRWRWFCSSVPERVDVSSPSRGMIPGAGAPPSSATGSSNRPPRTTAPSKRC